MDNAYAMLIINKNVTYLFSYIFSNSARVHHEWSIPWSDIGRAPQYSAKG